MKLLFAIALVAISFNTIAQTNYDKSYYQLKVDKYNRKKTGGLVMIVAGTVSAIVGISQLSPATTTYYSNVNGVSQERPKSCN